MKISGLLMQPADTWMFEQEKELPAVRFQARKQAPIKELAQMEVRRQLTPA